MPHAAEPSRGRERRWKSRLQPSERYRHFVTVACPASDALRCELQRIADALEAQPGWFELLSSVIVPLVLGLATLAVAVLSWRLSIRVHRFEKESGARTEARDARARRAEFGGRLLQYSDVVVDEWAGQGMLGRRDGRLVVLAPDSAPLQREIESELLKEPGDNARLLFECVRDCAQDVAADNHDINRAHFVALLKRSNRYDVEAWVSDPEAWVRRGELDGASRTGLPTGNDNSPG